MANQKLNSTHRSSTFWNEISRLFDFRSNIEIKYCTIYRNPNSIYKYFCYKNEICCKTGNGCCSTNSFYRYLESWAFWSCVFFRLCIVLLIGLIYFICWYCKKLEKDRHSRALRQVQQRRQANNTNSNGLPQEVNTSRLTSRNNGSGRSRDRVDRLLENLIRDYSSRLIPDQPATRSTSKATSREPPPKYSDALNMPQPNRSSRMSSNQSQNRPQSGNIENEGQNFVVIEISNSDQRVPSYEEAVRRTHNV